MNAEIGLFLMLLGVSHGVELHCDGRQEGAQCYGALGGTLVLWLMDSTSDIHKFQLFNQSTAILSGGKNRTVFNKIENRSTFTPTDGTFRVNNLSRTDNGEYRLEIFNFTGRKSEERTLRLIIQAPVSSVLLVSECLSQGETRLSCSSEGGDSPQYSWTLDGQPLTDAQLLSSNNETNNITLREGGNLVCSVSNHVNSVSKEVMVSTCGFVFIECTLPNGTDIALWVLEANNTLCLGPTTTTSPITEENLAIIAGALAALVILLVLIGAFFWTQKKKLHYRQNEEDKEQDVTYADVNIMKRKRRHEQQLAEVDVEYGQVRFSNRSRQTVKPAAEDCVYAQVRRK